MSTGSFGINYTTLFIFVFILLGTTSALFKLPCGEGAPNISRFQILPGGGWDNLRNLEMSPVFQPNFSTCIESVDGRYLLPPGVQLNPARQSQMEIYADVFEHYYSYRSLTSYSINVEAHATFLHFFSIGGSFSWEHQRVKTTQLNTKSITARVQLRHNLYTALLEQDMPLSDAFRNRLLDIGYQIKLNNSRVAEYLADLLVGGFGTHYITRVDAGAVISRRDFLKSNGRKLTDEDITKIRASASFGFASMFGISASWSSTVDVKTVEQYKRNLTDSQVESIGGKPLTPNISIKEWSDSVPLNLVPIDRAGLPLFYAVTTNQLGGLPYQLVGEIKQVVQGAVERYYKANIVKGCMKPGTANFNPMANVPSEQCKEKRFPFAFGGMYQTCTGPSQYCSSNAIQNIITGGYSCPAGYQAILLHSRTFRCDQFCHGWWLFEHCNTQCSTYSLYWCSAEYKYQNIKTGYLFGGLYSSRANNPMTQQKTCPSSYLTFTVGAGDFSICLSRDFELGEEHAFNFGGFFSCVSGNPYTILQNKTRSMLKAAPGNLNLRATLLTKTPTSWPEACPPGYTQHLAAVDGNCEVMFCTKAGELKLIPPAVVQSPPFIRLPANSVPPPRLKSDITLDVPNGAWKYKPDKSTWELQNQVSHLTGGVAFLGTVLGTVFIGLIIYGFIFLRRRRRFERLNNPETQPLLGGAANIDTTSSA